MGRPDEVSGLDAFLLNDRASYITGASIDVAGGMGRYVQGRGRNFRRSAATSPERKPMPSDPDELRDFARRYTEAWCSQDPAQVAAHYAPDGSLTINGGTPSVGRAAITEAARSFMTAFPDMCAC
jgi:hypothetical protein